MTESAIPQAAKATGSATINAATHTSSLLCDTRSILGPHCLVPIPNYCDAAKIALAPKTPKNRPRDRVATRDSWLSEAERGDSNPRSQGDCRKLAFSRAANV